MSAISQVSITLVVRVRNAAIGSPIDGLAAGLAAALPGAACELICLDDRDDPDAPAPAASPTGALRIVRRPPAERGGGTVAALLRGARLARGTTVAFAGDDWRGALAALPALLSALERADLAVAARPRAARAPAARLAHALFTRARVCTDPFAPVFACRRAVVAGVALLPEGEDFLLDVLVCGAWRWLAEVPAASATSGAPIAPAIRPGELRRLALHGGRAPGRVRRVEASGLTPDAAAPEPLDDDLPEPPGAGPSRRRLLGQIAAIALALRLALLPLGHPWDTVTFYNMLVDLGHGRSPYASLPTLTDIARAAGWGPAYEGYAYPPAVLYLYEPLARIFVWLHPALTTHYAVEGQLAIPTIPPDFYLWLKLPFWLGDLGIAALLWRMTGTARRPRDYLLNPYVLLVSGCWTFDSVMVLALLLGVYWLQRGRLTWSAAALAVGTMLKFVPGFLVPTCALYLVQRKRPARELALFVGAYVLACGAMAAPFLGGVVEVLGFQGSRPGYGLHWEMLLVVAHFLPRGVDWAAVNVAVGTYSLGVLAMAMLLAYGYVFRRRMPLHRMVLVTLLTYLLATKVVNEQYALALLPFSYIELQAQRRGVGGWRRLHTFLWLTPLAFAAMNVPLDRFLLPLYHTVFGARAGLITASGGTALGYSLLPWYHPYLRWAALDALALWFMLLVALALVWLARHPLPQWATATSAQPAAAAPALAIATGDAALLVAPPLGGVAGARAGTLAAGGDATRPPVGMAGGDREGPAAAGEPGPGMAPA